jgi:NAD(P)-dependent dehydrogenase (short-subunit alcohol dehydrogenase family)
MTETRDLSSKTIVVSGATSGIGLATAKALAVRGAYVIGIGRSQERCAAAVERIGQAGGERVEFVTGDLASQRQVRALAAAVGVRAVEQSGGKIDVLINNAGAVASWYTATEDGYELQFAVNHLAPFLLTHELLDLLQAAPSARVLTVSSRSHRGMRMHWSDVMLRRFYNPLTAYRQSKLANVLFTCELNRRLAGGRVRAYAIDPGLVKTEIGLKGTFGIVKWVWDWRRRGGADPEEAAQTSVFVAADPSVEASREVYWKKCKPLAPDPYTLREDEAARLWKLSERLCGINA